MLHTLSPNDILDVMIEIKGRVVKNFVLNYRAVYPEIGEQWVEVYRVDTCHGYLHEQRFWLSPKPIRIQMGPRMNLREVLRSKLETLKQEYPRLRQLLLLRLLHEGSAIQECLVDDVRPDLRSKGRDDRTDGGS